MYYDKVVTYIMGDETSRTHWDGATNPTLQVEAKTERPLIRFGVVGKKLAWNEMMTMRPHEHFLRITDDQEFLRFVSIYGPLYQQDIERGFCRVDSTLKISKQLAAAVRVHQEGQSGTRQRLREAVKQYIEAWATPTAGGITDGAAGDNFYGLLTLEQYRTSRDGGISEFTDDDLLWLRENRYACLQSTPDALIRSIDTASDHVVVALANSILQCLRPKQQESLTVSRHGDVLSRYTFDDLYQFLKWLIWRDAWDNKPLMICENYLQAGK